MSEKSCEVYGSFTRLVIDFNHINIIVKISVSESRTNVKKMLIVVLLLRDRTIRFESSPRKPRRVVLAGRRRRRREQISERRKRFWRLESAADFFAVQRRRKRFVGIGIRQCTGVDFGVGLALHFALVSAHVRDSHRYPIVDPREGLTVAEQ